MTECSHEPAKQLGVLKIDGSVKKREGGLKMIKRGLWGACSSKKGGGGFRESTAPKRGSSRSLLPKTRVFREPTTPKTGSKGEASIPVIDIHV